MAVTYDPPPVPVWDPLEEEECDPVVFVSDAVSDGPFDEDVFVSILVEEIIPVAEPDALPVGVAVAEDGFVDPDPVADVGLPEDVEDVGVEPAVP